MGEQVPSDTSRPPRPGPGEGVGGGVNLSPKGKKGVGRGTSLDHLRPQGLVGLISQMAFISKTRRITPCPVSYTRYAHDVSFLHYVWLVKERQQNVAAATAQTHATRHGAPCLRASNPLTIPEAPPNPTRARAQSARIEYTHTARKVEKETGKPMSERLLACASDGADDKTQRARHFACALASGPHQHMRRQCLCAQEARLNTGTHARTVCLLRPRSFPASVCKQCAHQGMYIATLSQ